MLIDTTILPTLDDIPARAAAAEAFGVSGVWIAETSHDPFVMLALAAGTTERVTLGTNIAVALARSPMTVAIAANDVQALSGGRHILGLGSQVKGHITRRFSMPWSAPAARMREYVLALRAIWSCWNDGTPLSFEGEFYTHTLMTPVFSPGPNPHGAPPVYLAAVGERMTAVAAEVADGLLCHPLSTERYLREVTVPALRRVRPSLDGFAVCGMPIVATGRDDVEMAGSLAAARMQVAFYVSTPAYRPILDLHGWGELHDELHPLSREGRWAEMAERVDDEVLETIAVVAEPDQVESAVRARFDGLLTRCAVPLAG